MVKLEGRLMKTPCKFGSPHAVARIISFVSSSAIMKNSEQLDDLRVRTREPSKSNTVVQNTGPVGKAVYAPPWQRVLGEDSSDEFVLYHWH